MIYFRNYAKFSFLDDNEALTLVKAAAENAPSLYLYVDGAPGTYPPPMYPYLQGMADPAESETYTMLSFYRFSDISNPAETALHLQDLWKPFRALGSWENSDIRTYFLNY